MARLAKHLFIVLAAALVASCSPPKIDVTAQRVGDRIRVTLSQDWGLIFSRNRTPCVREAGLYVSGTYGRNAAAWLIEAQGDVQCLDLAAFAIGDTPKGFVQTVPFKAVGGETYTLRVGGIGWGEANVTL